MKRYAMSMAQEGKQPGVIVTDGNERSTLAVTRALGERGVPVYVGAETEESLAGVSRYCTRSFIYPSPWVDPEGYLSCVLEAAWESNVNVIFPMTDVAVELLGEHKERSGLGIVLPIPSLSQYRKLSDKYRLTAWAREQGISVPPTLFVPDGDVGRVLPLICKWPVVIKPGRSLIQVEGRWKKTSVLYARDRDELLKLFRDIWYLRWPTLLQERIVGEGQGVFGMFREGEPQALFAHRRIRERPPSGGVSVLRESIPLPEKMTDYALRVVKSTAWYGVAMVEFKIDQESHEPYLMEVNGRFWGSLQLAIDAGVNFPWLLYRSATGQSRLDDQRHYQCGIRSRWWLGDLDHLLLRLWKPEKELNLPPQSPSKFVTAMKFFSLFDTKTKAEVFRWRDLQPALYELGEYLQPLAGRVSSGICARLLRARLAVASAVWEMGILCGLHRVRTNQAVSRRIGTVLVLCKGNICRSPFAAQYLKQAAAKQRLAINIVSAGLETTTGKPAYPTALLASAKCGVDLKAHRTTAISQDLIEQADLILVMELAHVDALRRMFPQALHKTWLLGHFSSDPVTNIRDPYGRPATEFEYCYALIVGACDGLLESLGSSPHKDLREERRLLRAGS